MTRASDTARLLGAGGSILGSLDIGGGQIGGRRNIIINGAMQVAQRATSVTGIGASAGYFTCDRWNISTGGSAGRLTMTQTADGPVGFANCLKLDCTTADTSIAAGENLLLQQSFEGQDLQAIGKGVTGAKEVTLSFYVKANAAFDFVAELQDNDNSRFVSKLFSTTTDWVRQTITFPADVDDGSSPFDDDDAHSLSVNFWLHGGTTYTGGTLGTTWNETAANRAAGIDSFYSSTNNNFFITGVQLEVGSVATPFENRTFGEELSLCQRYFYKTFPQGTVPVAGFTRFVYEHLEDYASGYAYFNYTYPKEMRTIPTVVFYTTNDSANGTGRTSYYDGAWKNGTTAIHGSHTAAFASGYLQATTGLLLISYNLTADAEL